MVIKTGGLPKGVEQPRQFEMNGSIAILMHLSAYLNLLQEFVEDTTRLSSQLRT